MSIYPIVALFFLLSAASCRQTVLAPTNTLLDADADAGLVYTAVLYYGTSDDACFLDDEDEGEGVGLLFYDSGYDNICLSYQNGDVYLRGYYGTTKTLLVRVGDGSYSVKATYRPLTTYNVEIGKGIDEDEGMTVEEAEKIDVMFLLSIQEAKDSYGSSYAVDVEWMVDLKGYNAYELEVSVAKGTTECFTPEVGRMEGIELCLEFASSQVLTIYANDIEVGVYEDEVTGQKITFLYENVNDFTYVTRSGSAQSLFYVISSQVFWIIYEGDIEENDDNMIYYMELQNGADTSDGYSYSCINVYNGKSLEAVLYQQVQIICGECVEDDGYCEIKIFIRDGKAQVFTAFDYIDDGEVLTMEYDGQLEMLYISYGSVNFELFADELLMYVLEGNNYFQFRPIIGDINFESDGDYSEYEAEWTIEAGSIESIELESDGSDIVIDVYCDDYACIIGSYDDGEFTVYKAYEGSFDSVSLYYITDEEDPETCLSFEGEITLNHCGLYSQWEMYYHCFSLYPVDTVEISLDEDDGEESSSLLDLNDLDLDLGLGFVEATQGNGAETSEEVFARSGDTTQGINLGSQ